MARALRPTGSMAFWINRDRVHRAPVTAAQVEEVVITTLETTPPDATHWSTRSLARATGLSRTTISRIWRAFGLRPHRSETFKLSPDPLLMDKVRDILGLYIDPPDHAVVLCVDERSQIQALDRTAPLLPMQPGQAERRTHDYRRHGTASLFTALDVKTGKVIGEMPRRYRAVEFRKFLDGLDASMPPDVDVHLIMDSYGTHKALDIPAWFAKRPLFQVHFTPTYASWLNLVERWFAELTTRQLRRGVRRRGPPRRPVQSSRMSTRRRRPGLALHLRGRNSSPHTTQLLPNPLAAHLRSHWSFRAAERVGVPRRTSTPTLIAPHLTASRCSTLILTLDRTLLHANAPTPLAPSTSPHLRPAQQGRTPHSRQMRL